jgi:hypothetical protein
MSDKSGILSRGGTKTVEADPDAEPIFEEVEDLMLLVNDFIVLVDPVGEPVWERSGIVTERSNASL